MMTQVNFDSIGGGGSGAVSGTHEDVTTASTDFEIDTGLSTINTFLLIADGSPTNNRKIWVLYNKDFFSNASGYYMAGWVSKTDTNANQGFSQYGRAGTVWYSIVEAPTGGKIKLCTGSNTNTASVAKNIEWIAM